MIETPSLVAQYVHGVLRTELGLGTFEAQLARTEGPPAPGTTLFDTQTGFAVRRWCPPLLGLEPHCPPARYLARRRELGVMEAHRRPRRAPPPAPSSPPSRTARSPCTVPPRTRSPSPQSPGCGTVWRSPRSRPARARCAEIGRASCRERSVDLGGRRVITKKNDR